MEFTLRLNVLLMNLWGRKCSPRPTPPPSWLLPPNVEFLTSFFTLTFKRLFNSSLLSAIRVVSSAYLRLLIFLPTISVAQTVARMPCNVEDLGSISGLGRSPGEGKGFPLQYSGLENSMNCIDHGVTKSQTQLSDFHFTSLESLDET